MHLNENSSHFNQLYFHIGSYTELEQRFKNSLTGTVEVHKLMLDRLICFGRKNRVELALEGHRWFLICENGYRVDDGQWETTIRVEVIKRCVSKYKLKILASDGSFHYSKEC